jgi:NADH-quinone oxidoreductase subunit N
MIDKLAMLHPEMALFVTTCVVLALGLSKSSMWRKACAPATGIGLIVALYLSLQSPTTDGMFPNMLPYAKSLIAAMGLLMLPLMGGTVDVWRERSFKKSNSFDPLRVTKGEFYAFFLFSLMGVMLCASADDLIWLFLAMELTSLPTYVMVAMSSPRLRSQEAGVKYFFLGAMSAAIFLYGFAMLYGATGTTQLQDIAIQLHTNGLGMLSTIGLVMALIGVSFKIASVPMHFYTPDVYQGAASPVSAFLAFAPKAAGFLVLIQLLSTVGWQWGPAGHSLPDALRTAMWIIAALTMTVGNVLAFVQTNAKRMLAYSSIAHSGYMLVGLLVGPGKTIATNGLGASMFYLLVYGVMTVGAFAVIASLEKHDENGELVEAETLDDLRGLFRSRPGLAWVMTLCALSLLGMPPLLGFWGKLTLFTAGVSAGEIVLVVIMGVNSAIAAFYYLRFIRAAMLEERGDEERPVLTEAFGRRVAAGLSGVGVVALVIWASQLQRASDHAMQPNERIELFAPSAAQTMAPADAVEQSADSEPIVLVNKH